MSYARKSMNNRKRCRSLLKQRRLLTTGKLPSKGKFVRGQWPQIGAWNQQVEQLATTVLRGRKERDLKKNSLVASIGLPMRHRDDPTGTDSVPVARKKVVADVPSRPRTVSPGEFVPHPTLDAQRPWLGDLSPRLFSYC
jgi:hypothetical protein